MGLHVEPLRGLLFGVELEPCDNCVIFVACIFVVRVVVSLDLNWRWPWLDD